MKTQIIALEAHDDFISVRDRMSWAKSPRILLVWPKYEKIALRAADLRILQQHASMLGAEMGLITRRGDVRRDAERFGIPVFSSAKAAQRQSWAPRQRLTAPERRTRRKRADLEAMRQAAGTPEAGWRSRPLARIGFFALGVMAVLAIAAIFVPAAKVTITPVLRQQSMTLPVTAGKNISGISLAGNVPAHRVTISVSASQSARILTQSSIPDAKARGVARFTNLSQNALTIPAGTIVYSLLPSAVQFATLNDTHLPGNINAVVEVPIAAVKGGSDGNVPANAIQAIEGSLSLTAAVTNPSPTDGGSDRMAAAPSEADRRRLHDVVINLLLAKAQQQVSESLGGKDLLLTGTLKMGQVTDETYDPPAGQPGNLLNLTMSAEFTGGYVKGDDLDQLAEATLNASIPAGFAPVSNSMAVKVVGTPSVDSAGAAHFQMQLSRRIAQVIDLARANVLTRGHSPQAAQRILMGEFHMPQPPKIMMSPPWWPWTPLVPFRVTVTAVQ
jgi:hypothetical protein